MKKKKKKERPFALTESYIFFFGIAIENLKRNSPTHVALGAVPGEFITFPIVPGKYCQGKCTTKKQAVCLELGPLCSILEFSLPTQPPPPSRVIRGAFTGAV